VSHADVSHDGASNNAASRILARKAAEQAAIAKAQNPADLTDADIRFCQAS
jgi:hypothetical protein